MYSTPFDAAPRPSGRRRLIAVVLAALLALTLGQVAAYASHYQATLEGSTFQIDDNANFVVDAHPTVNTDWNNVAEARQQALDDDRVHPQQQERPQDVRHLQGAGLARVPAPLLGACERPEWHDPHGLRVQQVQDGLCRWCQHRAHGR